MGKKKLLVVLIISLTILFLFLAFFGGKSLRKTKAIIEENNLIQLQAEQYNTQNINVEGITDTYNNQNNQQELNDVELNDGFQLMKNADFVTKFIASLVISSFFSLVIVLLLFLKNKKATIYSPKTNKFDFLEDEENVKIFYEKKIVDMNSKLGINKIITSLTEGNICIIPCDTIYGICGIMSEKTRQELIKIKNRDSNKNNFIVLATLTQAHKLLGRNLRRPLYSLWPGPISIISYTKHNNVAVCVRVPDDEKLQKILSKTGPIYSTSVNVSGEAAINNVYEICAKFGDSVDIIAKDDNKEFVSSSTIINATQKTLKLVRKGEYPIEKIKQVAKIDC